MNNLNNLTELKKEYLYMLKENIIPFWLKNGLDKKNGGYWTALDRKGNIIERDKSVWFQGRFSWVLSTLYTDFEKKEEYLEAAKSGIDFLEKYCFDEDGDNRMFFRVTEEGKCVIKRLRYYFSETFCIIAMASYGRASRDKSYIIKAKELLERIDKIQKLLIPKFDINQRATISFGPPMIMLATVQELRKADKENREYYNKYIDNLLSQVKIFLYEEKKAILEQCNPDGTLQDHFEGRQLNPGHAIESSWFILREAIERDNDKNLIELGLKIFDWMWEWGWDKEYGGIIQFMDVLNKPKSDYWHDMKFWWPQTEAAIATLYAYYFTKDKKYLEKHFMVKEYTNKFIDKEFGEWFGYLHRDGSLSTDLKGNMYKGPFHIPRMYMKCVEMIDFIGKINK